MKLNLLLVAPLTALLVLCALYLWLSARLPEYVVRHVGADGIGYGSPGVVIGVMAALAVAAFGIAAWACLDFESVGHWYAGHKAMVVCASAAGHALVALAAVTVLVSSAGGGLDPAAAMGYALLGFVLVFAGTAALLATWLPTAVGEIPGR